MHLTATRSGVSGSRVGLRTPVFEIGKRSYLVRRQAPLPKRYVAVSGPCVSFYRRRRCATGIYDERICPGNTVTIGTPHSDYLNYPSLGPSVNERAGRHIRLLSLNIDGFVTLEGQLGRMDAVIDQALEDHSVCRSGIGCLYIVLDRKPNPVSALGPANVFDVGSEIIRSYVGCHVRRDMPN